MEDDEKQTIAYRIEIDKDVWDQLKSKTDKSTTMNERVCRLIYEEVGVPYPEAQATKSEKPKKKK